VSGYKAATSVDSQAKQNLCFPHTDHLGPGRNWIKKSWTLCHIYILPSNDLETSDSSQDKYPLGYRFDPDHQP
jgi:hypothetical protein